MLTKHGSAYDHILDEVLTSNTIQREETNPMGKDPVEKITIYWFTGKHARSIFFKWSHSLHSHFSGRFGCTALGSPLSLDKNVTCTPLKMSQEDFEFSSLNLTWHLILSVSLLPSSNNSKTEHRAIHNSQLLTSIQNLLFFLNAFPMHFPGH